MKMQAAFLCLPFCAGVTLAQPPNDDVNNPEPIGSLFPEPFTVSGTTVGATVDNAPDCGTLVTAPGVWYTVAGTGSLITASTCGAADFDTKLSVYIDDGGLQCVTGIDDTCGLQSKVDWTSETDTQYLILVHGFADETGDFDLTVSVNDLWISKTGGVLSAVPGEMLDYTIVANNYVSKSDCLIDNESPGCSNPECEAMVCAADPFCCDTEWDSACVSEAEELCSDLPNLIEPDLIGATLSDVFPPQLVDCRWTCTASGGGNCTAGPVSGDIDDTVDIPFGGSLTYTVDCEIDAGATGTVSNIATITTPPDFPDPEPATNSAIEQTAIAFAIPTLSLAGLAGLVLVLAGFGMWRRRR